MKVRAEYRKLLLSEDRLITIIRHPDFELLYDALNGADNRVGQTLKTLKFDFDKETAEKIKNAAEASLTATENPRDSFNYPLQMNFELTTKCPLRCPQCYCSLEGGKDLGFERALEVLRDGSENGLWEVNLSGGETMLYPHIYDLIKECSRLGVSSNIAVSGWGLDEAAINRLIEAGMTRIFVSLNGSTQEVNSHTRDGYEYALQALELIQKANFPQSTVNFVAHNSNCDDFPNMVALCEKYNVEQLVVMAAKPTTAYELTTVPDRRQTVKLAENIEEARKNSNVFIGVENCYSPLRAYMGKSFLWGNTNAGTGRGCCAGRYMISLSANGNFTPCRHLPFEENFKTIGEYWTNSGVLNQIRRVEDAPNQPCADCELGRYCLSCLAVNYKIEGAATSIALSQF